MPDNTNVNANSAVVVVGRTAPVPPGQQRSEKSIPVVIANDQSTIPVAEQNKIQSEVALSLLGIPRSEVALGIFADVNTYDVNPTEWTATPENYETTEAPNDTDAPTGTFTYGHGLTHVPEESGALIESPIDETAILTSKRFFRYQPGRVSAATFGVKTSGPGFSTVATAGPSGFAPASGIGIFNPAIRKYGIFDKFDGYYWETRNGGTGDNFCVVRRTQSLTYDNPVTYGTADNEQADDYGCTNPLDQTAPRGSETEVGAGGSTTTFGGYKEKKFGDLVIIRDKLLMIHAAAYDPTLLQPKTENKIGAIISSSNSITLPGLGKTISNVGYSTASGLMDITTTEAHGFYKGKYITLAGIGMTCYLSYKLEVNGSNTGLTLGSGYGEITTLTQKSTTGGSGTGLVVFIKSNASGQITDIKFTSGGSNFIQNNLTIDGYQNGDTITISGGTGGTFTLQKTEGTPKVYPTTTSSKFTNNLNGLADNNGYTVVKVSDANNFTVNVGVSTVKTIYKTGGIAVGIRSEQYIRYSKGKNSDALTGLEDKGIYQIKGEITYDESFSTGIGTVQIKETDGNSVEFSSSFDSSSSSDTDHYIVTPVPFIQPNATMAGSISRSLYTNIRTNEQSDESVGTGMFPYMYEDATGTREGFVDTTKGADVIKGQVDDINSLYGKWVNQNVDIDYLNVYEYRVPRSRFSGDRLDNKTDLLKYSDVVDTRLAGQTVPDPSTGATIEDTSIWNLEFDKVTMYKVEFSWYGAVGALFLAYVPVSNGEARWVRVHHLRASNQLKVSSLGNATLPITYMTYGGGGPNKSFGYHHEDRKINFVDALGNESYSENIVKYGASYYIDGGDRGTVKLFSHATPDNIDIFGSKRLFTNTDSTNALAKLNFNQAGNTTEPYLSGATGQGLGGSYYIGAKVITGNVLDQNIKVIYTEKRSGEHRLYLNKTLTQKSGVGNVTLIPNRPTSVIGLKCRDFIQSSTGRSVRNRTQVYPTRLSTGSLGPQVVQMDFLKTPLFQTTSIVTSTADASVGSIALETNDLAQNDAQLGDGSYNLEKRGKPLAVKLPLTTYAGTHTFIPGSSDLANAIALSSNTSTKYAITAVTYNSTTGKITATTGSAHGLSAGTEIRILKKSLTFTCSLDDNATEHSYPRVTDPIFDGVAPGGTNFDGSISGDYSRPVKLLTGTGGSTLVFSVTTDTSGNTAPDVASAAEYIRDIGTGVYGYFRARFKTENPTRYVSILGFLENRGQDRTKGNIQNDNYYFSAIDSTEDDVILEPLSGQNFFLYEDNVTPKDGTIISSAQNDFTLAPLSSVKVSPQLRAPIPNTGIVVSSIFVPPNTGEAYDLASYFDYNKEYLSFPLTNTVESLFLVASSKDTYNAGTPAASMSASITWEEQ